MNIWNVQRKIQQFMAVQSTNPELLKAQYRAFTHQMPMMYFILLTSTWALAVTHLGLAPYWLTLGVPSLFTVGCLLRVFIWLRTRNVDPSPELALTALQRTNGLAGAIASAFTLWSFALVPYGDAYTRSHVAFYMAITVISCIFCLMYLRSAAFIVTIVVNGAFIAFFVSTAQPTFVAIAINILLVCAGMMSILLTNYRNFESMVVSKQKSDALSNENFRLANLDSLTGLGNRRAFFAALEVNLRRASTSGTRMALAVMDLDGFKPVNDLYGHSVGDRLLVDVANRLSETLTASTAFRLGGDEFAIIAPLPPENTELLINANNVAAQLRQPYQMPEGVVHISASMGIAVFPDLALSPEELFDRADYALYHAKKRHRGGAVLFNTDHKDKINLDARIESVLKQANLEKELSLVFQPIVNVSDHSILGFEALARWASPTLGEVSPARFIPVAERAGIIGELTKTLLRKALAAATCWDAHLRLAFNLSAHDLNSNESALAILSVVERSGFDPKRLDLEITETAFAHDFAQITHSVEMLRRLGCGISLDDFGTGYSSLTRLHALPLTKFKIDRSFVANLHTKPASYKIVKSLLALSADMGLDCVIEGVETKEELQALKALGGTSVQGYLFSPPLPEDEARYLAAQHTHRYSQIAV